MPDCPDAARAQAHYRTASGRAASPGKVSKMVNSAALAFSKLAKKKPFLYQLTSSGQAVSAVVAITARPQFWCRMTPLPTQSSFSPAARIIRGSPRKTPCRHRKSLGRMSSRYFRQDFISLVRQAIWRVQRRTSLLHQQFSLKVLHQRIHRIVRYLQRIACIFDPQ